MTFSKFIADSKQGAKIAQEIMARGALSVTREGNSVVCSCWPHKVGGVARRLLTGDVNIANRIELMLVGRALCDGPKIFKPRQLDLEVLEQVALNISFRDYTQPFHTVIVEFPANYLEKKVVHSPMAGEYHYGIRHPDTHYPTFAIVQWHAEVEAIYTMVQFSSDVSIKTAFIPRGEETVEDYITQLRVGENEFANCLETTREEWELVRGVLRSVLNYCLLIDEVGTKKVGPENPRYYKRLRHFMDVANRRGTPVSAARDYVAHPVVYELNQHVDLYDTVASDSELGDESFHVSTGRTMPPHHRRGFYRMQPHGPKSSLRKLVRIKPVFVNKYLFVGDMAKARATYVRH